MNQTQTSKITQYLQDAKVLEGTLRRTLIAHIAVSARDEHRELLQDHLRITVAQERRLTERLTELEGGQNPAQAAIGAVKGAGALVLTLAKGPADALRGPTGDDVALRNAQDECASEQLEIAVYDALEALANELGDERTATLAREHRTQEEVFLKQLRAVIPELAKNVANNAQGKRRFPLPTVGALDAARALVAGAQTVLRSDDDDTTTFSTPAAQSPSPTAAPQTGKPKADTKPKADPLKAPAPKVKAATKAHKAAPAKQAGAPTPPPAPAPTTKQPSPAPGNPDQPIAQYDDMTPYEISQLLDHLPDEKLDEVQDYERANKNRDLVIDAIDEQRAAPAAKR